MRILLITLLALSSPALSNPYDDAVRIQHAERELKDYQDQQKVAAEKRYNAESRKSDWKSPIPAGILFAAIVMAFMWWSTKDSTCDAPVKTQEQFPSKAPLASNRTTNQDTSYKEVSCIFIGGIILFSIIMCFV